MYEYGRGVPKSETEAVNWYRKSADQRDADGQRSLGVMYSNGRGVPKDEVVAVNWFRKSADQGNAEAQRNIAIMYEYGRVYQRVRQRL